MRVLFTSLGLTGHLHSLVPLAWACRCAGHDVALCVPHSAAPAAVRTGLPVLSVHDDGIDAASLAAAPDARARGHLFGWSARHRLDDVRAVADRWRPDLVVVERAEFAGRLAAEELGVPCAELRWSVAAPPECVVGAREVITGRRSGPLAWAEPDVVLTPWPAHLRGGGEPAVEFRPVSYEGPADVTGLLFPASSGRRVCVTLGTVLPHTDAHPHRRRLPEVVAALADSGFDVVVAVDPEATRAWGTTGRVSCVGRAPLTALLETSDLVLHHGGHGTTLATALSGLPSLVVPAFDDQFDNALALERVGAGVVVPSAQFGPAHVVTLAEEALGDVHRHRAAADLSRHLRSGPPLTAVTDLLTELATGAVASCEPRAATSLRRAPRWNRKVA